MAAPIYKNRCRIGALTKNAPNSVRVTTLVRSSSYQDVSLSGCSTESQSFCQVIFISSVRLSACKFIYVSCCLPLRSSFSYDLTYFQSKPQIIYNVAKIHCHRCAPTGVLAMPGHPTLLRHQKGGHQCRNHT